ncbi:sensor histidine kinase [Robiginitalea sp. SC105]|uniref:sensor histidine kinase n=1 Tax=Robiginitalea sp. SC105 TaxID=2762332 RepID=UPI00163B0B80|nr:sensor histidine kinase [Robiginitalea sp. SC105]MBC2839780.1 hypothetical protein [Robiginitalea sp. SC105]
MMQRFSIWLFLLLIYNWGYSQNQFSRVNYYEELNSIIITDLLADRNSEIWISTLSGLYTFDGYDFRNYYPDPKDSTTIDDLLLYKLEEGSNGDIWIGSQGKVYRRDVKTGLFRNYPIYDFVDYPENAQANISEIESDGKGTIYFGINSRMGYEDYPGLLKFSESTETFEMVTLPDGEAVHNVYQMASNPEGEIALVTNQGLVLIESGSIRSLGAEPGMFSEENQEFPSDIVWDDHGNIWFVTNQWRLGKIDPAQETVEFLSFPSSFNGVVDWTTRIGFDQNYLWISHRDGVELFDVNSGKFSAPSTTTLRPFTAFLNDAMGNIWLGTQSYGLYSIPPQQLLTSYLHNPDDPNSVTEGWATTPFEDESGNVWFATYNSAGEEGLNKINPTTGEIEKFLFKDRLPQFNRPQMINAYDKGRLLFRDGRKLYGYDVNTGQVIDPHILDETADLGFLHHVYRDSEGDLWISTMSGLYRQTRDSYERYDFSRGEMGQEVSNEVLEVMESRHGGLWVQTNAGLFLLDKATGSFKRHGFDPKDGPVFSSQDINSLLEDEDGTLWVGTWQGGLNRYNPETGEIRYYGLDEGLPSPSIQGILEDNENNVLWMSTFRGMARFDKATEQITSYGNAEGAQNLYADHSVLELSNGLFAFGGSNGITIFDPLAFTEDTQPPITRITGMKVGDESVTDTKGAAIILDHTQKNISITYTGIHYDNPQNNQFAYRLSPTEDEWRYVGGSRSAYYYDLPPGEYTFSVRAANPNMVWSDAKTISFSITPPWWRTTWAYAIFALLLALMAYRFHLFQRHRTLRRERERTQAKELEHAREIEKAYEQLKATQTQLIHSEKMASLGELTAGIAHEIQNPLNFVNNFSEVNSELIKELKEDLKAGKLKEVQDIADDIDENEQKIIYHGKRAEGIVKGMLQHSRSSDGKKEPTDLNKLADEYLRLAYHGLRAKDKSFNASVETNFDQDLPRVSVIPQDIGRVLLNLLTNAFHAVQERQKQGEAGYEPKVTVSTKKANGGVEIRVADNGNGIPEKIREKIFQPFFTTKPTGAGTGLGLSMSYDIVTKGHNGELKVNSKEGEGATFLVNLPR